MLLDWTVLEGRKYDATYRHQFQVLFFFKHPVQRLVRAAMGFEGVDGLDKVVWSAKSFDVLLCYPGYVGLLLDPMDEEIRGWMLWGHVWWIASHLPNFQGVPCDFRSIVWGLKSSIFNGEKMINMYPTPKKSAHTRIYIYIYNIAYIYIQYIYYIVYYIVYIWIYV